MITAFADTNVLFAAALSPTGASRELLRESIRGNVALVLSNFVLAEAERNLMLKRPDAFAVLQGILDALPFALADPTSEEVAEAATYTVLKDAPIVAAARKANVDYLVSLDRKHLVSVAEVAQRSGLTIVLPEVVLDAVRQAQNSPRG